MQLRQLIGPVFVLSLIAVAMFFFFGNPDELTLLTDALPVFYSGIALAMLIGTYFLYHRWSSDVGRAWFLLSIGMACWFIAELLFGIFDVTTPGGAPYPSLADAMWLIGYPLLIIGTWLLLGAISTGKTKVLLVGSAITVAVLVFVLFFIAPQAMLETDLGVAFFNIAYPALDAFLVGMAICILILSYGRPGGRAWVSIAGGLILITAADVLYAFLTFEGAYVSGNIVDLVWVLGYSAIGWGAYLRATQERTSLPMMAAQVTGEVRADIEKKTQSAKALGEKITGRKRKPGNGNHKR